MPLHLSLCCLLRAGGARPAAPKSSTAASQLLLQVPGLICPFHQRLASYSVLICCCCRSQSYCA